MTPTERESSRYAVENLGAGYRFGAVLVLLFATFVFLASAPTGSWVRVVAVSLQGVTLLAAFVAARAHRRLIRIAALIVLLTFVGSIVSLFVTTSPTGNGVFFGLSALLVAAAPVAIIHGIVVRRVVDIETVLAAICVYVLFGMIAAFVFGAVDVLGSSPFFVQVKHATVADYLYFSFVTITTTGYGDLTAGGGLGRALAALEALIGQLYLVTVLALLVSNLRPSRRMRPDESA